MIAGRRGWWAVLAGVVAVPFLALAAFLLLVPPPVEPFEPVTWVPPALVPAESRAAIGTDVGVLVDEDLNGPEDVAVDADERLYVSTRDGRILRVDPDAGQIETFAEVGGRPLGLQFAASGELLVANQGIGLQAVTPAGEVRLLADSAGGEPLRSANDLAVASDGIVYLTDSNGKYTPTTLGARASYSLYDFLEGRPQGRVLAYDPVTTEIRVIAEGLYFPNGIVLAEDEQSVLVGESTRYRVTRLWIGGDRVGTAEVFLDNVPGISDGFTRDSDGRLILATYERVEALDEVILPSVVARHVAVRLPADLLNGDPLPGALLELTEDGRIIRSHTGLDPAATTVTSWRGGWVLGALLDEPLRFVKVP
ncbi:MULTISPECIES: SMP-30/gluconolactonase/LRE family protein [Actinoalloteichus]|uniref:Strictosidine synthase n=1 Tax=Actinoalloteichus fjordicus TaxID=1612552 RepID=A0AAC9L927_9PSEU|nr:MULTISPECIES: SMP-30/gluconolactonase/LRE family protein [Actinoalloteichus]APU13156.1 Strictosidine synthase [Actinoalloteichus fjordicus]APU19106.1 Strictosidine synthase [Actinoalloteichus sp. GBA129-24]